MTTNTATGRRPVQTVESFLSQVGQIKQAEANTEAGSIGGPTTHPVKGVDDNTEPANEGARSAENTKDVKKDQGSPSVDSTSVATAKTAGGPGAEDHLQLGTTVAATGEDPANETNKAKAGKNDPGSTHPARTDNEALDGFKYAEAELNTAPLEKLASALQDIGNSICADLVNQGAVTSKQAGAQTAGAGQQIVAPQQTKAATIDPQLASQIGWDLAGILTNTLDKQAADVMVQNQLAELVKLAEEDAYRTGQWLIQFKQAEAMPPMEGGGGEGAGGAGGEADMAAMLGGGGPPAGGPPAGGPGGGDDLAQLDAMLKELGISPQDLMAALSEEGGAGGPPAGGPPGADAGGPPAGGPGMPPPEGAGLPPDPEAGGMMPAGAPGMEVTAAFKDAVTKQAVAMINEIVNRSKGKRAAATR